ncbi:iron complex outermembrane receptor protein [Rhodanobacter soli]|uniref:Iron complex outermembrane receptor protein n=1 Tax=Rhodanobacter soli TaxID=590609 RepID=A0ABV2Q029_9GAMM
MTSRRPAGWLRRALVVCVAWSLSAGCPGTVDAASGAFVLTDGPTRFSIPPQPLSSALMALGRQADVQILTSSNTIAGRRSTGTSGKLKVEVALARLLEGTGLDYEVIGRRTVVVRQRDFTPAVSYESRLSGTKPSVPIVSVLDTVRVSGLVLADMGFMAGTTRGATRTDSNLADLPQSVSIVTRDLMDSKQAFEVADVVRHVAGVDYVDGFGGPPLFRIRGFSTGNGLTDGMPNGVARIEDLPPLIGIERVEVLKGPETILGESSVDNNFGGSVNIVMKRPQAEPVRQLVFSAGRHDGTRLGVDLAGPLDQQGRLTYRWVAAGNRADRTAQGYHGQRSGYLAPSIAWQGDTTQLLFGLEYVDNRVPVPDHTVLLGPSLAESSSFDVLLGNPDDHARYRTHRAFYMAEQALGGDWSLRSRGQYVSQHSSGQAWAFSDTQRFGLTEAAASTYRYADAFYTLQNELAASFDQGMLAHDVLLGIDYARTHAGNSTESNVITTGQAVNVELQPNNLLPSATSQDASLARTQPLGGSWSTNTGVFVQDQISIGESWDVLATVRHATYELAGGAEPTLRRSKWVPRLGVVYKPAPGVSLYASSNTGFQVDALLGEDGRPLPPSVSRQIEVGTKLDMFDQRARLSAAWYRIRLDHSINRISPEPPHFAVPGPGQTNSGVEIEFEGQVLPGLDVSASYTGARIRNHDGSPPYGAPRHQWNAWASYHFQRSTLQSWGVAGGVFARSRTMGRVESGGHFVIPGQLSAEANLTYYADAWSATLGVKNLFARTLYAVNAESSFVPVREGRMILLSGTYNF